MKSIKKIFISGAEVFPIIEGGKGIGVTNGETAGAFAAADAVGTLSVVFTPNKDDNGRLTPISVAGKSRKQKSVDLIEKSIINTVKEIETAYRISEGKGRIHINILWGIAGAEKIIHEVLSQTRGKVHGITCGAGMPYKLAEIAKQYNVYYYPIVSSARAFGALWARSYKHVPELLGGIVYEDPWKAGGHNGITNKEDPKSPELPIGRITDLRSLLIKSGLSEVPIIMAGGVWNLKEYEDWFDNEQVGPIAFQFGTRPLLTKESPISKAWKDRLLEIKEGDISLNKFSSTGFYSSALNNDFLKELYERSQREVTYNEMPDDDYKMLVALESGKKNIFVNNTDYDKIHKWMIEGYSKALVTPDSSIIFVTNDKAKKIRTDQKDCKGCLAACRFSGWCDSEELNYSTGKKADPRSFCILKTLQNVICEGDVDHELVFSGHNSYNFSIDPLYSDCNVPTIKELVDKILVGE